MGKLLWEPVDDLELYEQIVSCPVHFAGNITRRQDAWQQMMSTELNALANATAAVQNTATNPAYNNAAVGALYDFADFEVQVTFASGPTAGLTLDIYLARLSSTGGTTFWNLTTSFLPGTLWKCSIPVAQINTIQILGAYDMTIPLDKFVVALNNGTNQAFPATGSTLNMRPHAGSYT